MPFDWHDYLSLARELAGQPGVVSSLEAKQRSAISRAYYAVILKARKKVAIWQDARPPRKSTHSWTIGGFTKHSDPHVQRIGKNLKRLKKRREAADYEDSVINLNSELTSALQEAEDLIRKINLLP